MNERLHNVPPHVAIERAANAGSDVILIGGEQYRELVVASIAMSMPNTKVTSYADFGKTLRRFAGSIAEKPVLHVHKQADRLTITIMDMVKLEQSSNQQMVDDGSVAIGEESDENE